MEGATSYSITFDLLTKTEANHDFVRFLKVRLAGVLLYCFAYFLEVSSTDQRDCVGFHRPKPTKE